MPIYAYKCDDCGTESEEFQRITEDPYKVCQVCGRDEPVYHRVPTLPHTDLKEFHKPIEMYSIGLNDEQEIREFKAKCPDVDVSTDPNDPMYGVPIARSRKQKLDAYKAMGFVETN